MFNISVGSSQSFTISIEKNDGTGVYPNNSGDNTRVTFDESRVSIVVGSTALSSGGVLTDSTYGDLVVTPKHVGVTDITVEYGTGLGTSSELVQAEAVVTVNGVGSVKGAVVSPHWA
jgi:hypothetical protein